MKKELADLMTFEVCLVLSVTFDSILVCDIVILRVEKMFEVHHRWLRQRSHLHTGQRERDRDIIITNKQMLQLVMTYVASVLNQKKTADQNGIKNSIASMLFNHQSFGIGKKMS